MKKLVMMATCLFAFSAYAEEEKAESATLTNPPCQSETASVYTSHNYNGYSIADSESRFNNEKSRIQEVADKAGVKLKFTGENYSISPMNYEQPSERDLYNYSANLNYEITPADKAKEYFRQLSAANINASLSYTKNSNCEQAQGE